MGQGVLSRLRVRKEINVLILGEYETLACIRAHLFGSDRTCVRLHLSSFYICLFVLSYFKASNKTFSIVIMVCNNILYSLKFKVANTTVEDEAHSFCCMYKKDVMSLCLKVSVI